MHVILRAPQAHDFGVFVVVVVVGEEWLLVVKLCGETTTATSMALTQHVSLPPETIGRRCGVTNESPRKGSFAAGGDAPSVTMRWQQLLLLLRVTAGVLQQRHHPLASRSTERSRRSARRNPVLHGSSRGGGGAAAAEEDHVVASIAKTAVTVGFAAAFGVGVGVFRGQKSAVEFFAGYLVEQTLSVDNLFVFILLFEYFKVPPALQERALRWGVVGAVVMRGVMISVGVAAVRRFRSVTLVFAAILLASSLKLLTEGAASEDVRDDNPVVRLARHLCDAVDYFDGDKFFTTLRDGRRVATPLLLCVLCIELSDFVFAVDSIPAVLAVSQDPFVVYSSNVFAIAALRSLYAVLAAAIRHLPYLRPSVALILGFVGLKMLADYFDKHLDTGLSLAIIVLTLLAGVLASLLESRVALREPTAAVATSSSSLQQQQQHGTRRRRRRREPLRPLRRLLRRLPLLKKSTPPL